MSDTVDLQLIYAPQTHIINTPFEKQQPASKLVNKYLSTAAQYLNRTKSFHVPPTNNNNNTHILQPISSAKDNLVQSMHSIGPLTTVQTSSNNLPMSTNENTSSSIPLNYNNNSINSNKSQGLVNTLRRSLRKSRERFYNKRSTTMKSCHSLNTCEQIPDDHYDIHTKMSMTPTLLYRRQQMTNKNETYTLRKPLKNDLIRKKKKKETSSKIIYFLQTVIILITILYSRVFRNFRSIKNRTQVSVVICITSDRCVNENN